MKYLITLILFLTCLNLFAQKSGISGNVIEVSGNQMPGAQNNPKPSGIRRELCIYELTRESQATKENSFYKKITSRSVAKTKSKPDGTFIIYLKPGKYSIFIKEKAGLFANIIDSEGYINPVVVDAQKITMINIRVDYKAAY
jgi:hypothetical protein